jgi:UDP-N-acetylmuramate--alanine ligase
MTTHLLPHTQHIHFIGIGGAGMAGIAEVLLRQGYKVSGSDLNQNTMTQHLQNLGAIVMPTHCAENIAGASIVVTSTAITGSNPELMAAKKAGIPVLPRAHMLADLMRMKHHGIAIAGTHGKTTTTSLLASILTEAGADPTFVIGGLLKSAGAHAYLGESEFFVAEADESDASFLHLCPKVAIVTNIDADHMETYQHDFNQLKNTFIQFLHRLPFNGLAVVCIDDPVIQEILPRIARPTLTYGFHASADLQITAFEQVGFQSHLTLRYAKGNKEITLILNLPGRHNALNAAAVAGVALSFGIAHTAIQTALQKFSGVGRRSQIYGDLMLAGDRRVWLIDDYGHHPREITATWLAVRQAYPTRRLVVIYQPHRYSRTQDLFAEFVAVLSEQVDQLILLDIYAAGETPIAGMGQSLFEAIQQRSKTAPIFVPDIEKLPAMLDTILKEGDVLLTQGAGSVGGIAPKLVQQWGATAQLMASA